ncbi:type II toxin-antitoxin system VapC family toxin [Nocardia sp. NPDC058497]|uniref:type II toxin-antitoxin system VapC family toxin n=1 Tax=Nocardia sp. NPDC058497 TaxID=3346529 RepID=UPI003659FA16
MIVPDVNLLLYATISVYPQHEAARSWWEEVINSGEEVGLAAPAVFGFIRIATNPRVMSPPMAIETALDYVTEWLQQPNVNHLVPGPRHVDIAFELLRKVGTGANLTTDAQLAALAIEYDAEMASNDTDFARFPELRWQNPLR